MGYLWKEGRKERICDFDKFRARFRDRARFLFNALHYNNIGSYGTLRISLLLARTRSVSGAWGQRRF